MCARVGWCLSKKDGMHFIAAADQKKVWLGAGETQMPASVEAESKMHTLHMP